MKHLSPFRSAKMFLNLQICMMSNVSPKHIEGTPMGTFDRPCAPSLRLDQNFKMADDEDRFMWIDLWLARAQK